MKIRGKGSMSPPRAPAASLVWLLWMVDAHTAPSVVLFTEQSLCRHILLFSNFSEWGWVFS